MRKIITKEARDRREKRNKIIIGIILVGIMILSTAGYAFFQAGRDYNEKVEYNGVEFLLKEDGLWHFKIQEQEFATFYNPTEVKDIDVSGSMNLQNYYGKALYYSHNSNLDTINEIVKNLGRFTTRIQEVCIDNCEEDLPVKNCSDNIIIAKEENETLIKQEENCVYIIGEKEELIKLGDAFIFKILGI